VPYFSKLLTTLALATLPTQVFASDNNLLNPEPAFSWTGLYSSIGVGISRAELEQSGLSTDDSDPNYILSSGYLHDFNGLVVGAQFDLEFGNTSAQLAGTGFSIQLETNVTLEAAARIGVAADRFLVTGHLGYSWIESTQSGTTLAGTFNNSSSDRGIVYGAAVDYALTKKIFIGAEYSRKQYDDLENTGVDLEFDMISARIGYKF